MFQQTSSPGREAAPTPVRSGTFQIDASMACSAIVTLGRRRSHAALSASASHQLATALPCSRLADTSAAAVDVCPVLDLLRPPHTSPILSHLQIAVSAATRTTRTCRHPLVPPSAPSVAGFETPNQFARRTRSHLAGAGPCVPRVLHGHNTPASSL